MAKCMGHGDSRARGQQFLLRGVGVPADPAFPGAGEPPALRLEIHDPYRQSFVDIDSLSAYASSGTSPGRGGPFGAIVS